MSCSVPGETYFKFPKTARKSSVQQKLDCFLQNVKEVYEEYEYLQQESKPDREIHEIEIQKARSNDNKSLNRYRDIVPYNSRAVKIPIENAKPGEEHFKYINASWILFKEMKQKFIASQVCVFTEDLKLSFHITTSVGTKG